MLYLDNTRWLCFLYTLIFWHPKIQLQLWYKWNIWWFFYKYCSDLPISDGTIRGKMIIWKSDMYILPMNWTYMASLWVYESERCLKHNPRTMPQITPPNVASVSAFSLSFDFIVLVEIPILTSLFKTFELHFKVINGHNQ